jgi:hypothetical protein
MFKGLHYTTILYIFLCICQIYHLYSKSGFLALPPFRGMQKFKKQLWDSFQDDISELSKPLQELLQKSFEK